MSNVRHSDRRHLVISVIKSILLYGSEAWAIIPILYAMERRSIYLPHGKGERLKRLLGRGKLELSV